MAKHLTSFSGAHGTALASPVAVSYRPQITLQHNFDLKIALEMVHAGLV